MPPLPPDKTGPLLDQPRQGWDHMREVFSHITPTQLARAHGLRRRAVQQVIRLAARK